MTPQNGTTTQGQEGHRQSHRRTEYSCSRWQIPCFTRWQARCFTLGETTCQLKSNQQFRSWCSLSASERRHSLVGKDSQHLRAPKRLSQGRRSMFVGEVQELHHQPNAKDERHHSVHLVETVDARNDLGIWKIAVKKPNQGRFVHSGYQR